MSIQKFSFMTFVCWSLVLLILLDFSFLAHVILLFPTKTRSSHVAFFTQNSTVWHCWADTRMLTLLSIPLVCDHGSMFWDAASVNLNLWKTMINKYFCMLCAGNVVWRNNFCYFNPLRLLCSLFLSHHQIFLDLVSIPASLLYLLKLFCTLSS